MKNRWLIVGLTFVSAIIIPEIVGRLETKDLADMVDKRIDERLQENQSSEKQNE